MMVRCVRCGRLNGFCRCCIGANERQTGAVLTGECWLWLCRRLGSVGCGCAAADWGVLAVAVSQLTGECWLCRS